MKASIETVLEKLRIADPDLAEMVTQDLAARGTPPPVAELEHLANMAVWALSQETGFGLAAARGYLRLLGRAGEDQTATYRRLVQDAGKQGPTLGKMMAETLVPVILSGQPGLLPRFLDALKIMLRKGTYVLKAPLEVLTFLLEAGETDNGAAYLHLLGVTFSQALSYAQSQHFAHTLPRAVKGFDPDRRRFQISALARIMAADFHLADFFLAGMEGGLRLLDAEALHRFVTMGLEKLPAGRRRAEKFLSLESLAGQEVMARFQVTVSLAQVEQPLNRYLKARLGRAVQVRPSGTLSPPSGLEGKEEGVCTDGRFIFLPDEIGLRSRKEENLALYKCLVRLEAAALEYDTFNLDLDKLWDTTAYEHLAASGLPSSLSNPLSPADVSELEAFYGFFKTPALAADLFTIFEHGRHRLCMAREYPGLIRDVLPLAQAEALKILIRQAPSHPLFSFYMAIALGMAAAVPEGAAARVSQRLMAGFCEAMAGRPAVEASARLVIQFYPCVGRYLGCGSSPAKVYRRLLPPFGRLLRPDLVLQARRRYEHSARLINAALAARGVKVYRAALRRKMVAKDGLLTQAEIREIALSPEGDAKKEGDPDTPSRLDIALAALEHLDAAENCILEVAPAGEFTGPVFWYREWDSSLGDYLLDHVRLGERMLPEGDADFYARTLERHQGLVEQIRGFFKLLRPEGLKMLRQWVEGDAFDYRALLDFAIDRRAGRMPSDRLYIKHLKQERDVAVMLLVDLSRSTANQVSGARTTVLEVEKEALVLFSEAIQVLGDRFAIAGFSGTGRLGVDYFSIKNFDEAPGETLRQRIGAMAPQRGTRMGAAIRHATTKMAVVPARIRLMIVLGDGFPNDLEYKQDYAIGDTSQAVAEARAQGIFVHGITVNLPGDPKLDVLYGNVHHNVISDVRELPDRLWRIYSALTRY